MPPKVGRPRKADNPDATGDEKKKQDKKKYMREYKAKINGEIIELSKMEEDCDKELEKIKKEKAKLINDLEKANNQAGAILKEKVGKTKTVKKMVKVSDTEMKASSTINRAVKGKIARNNYKETEKSETFKLLVK
mgnify:CR=1 FL=1|tara:strand:+ start:7733 stop:8137 length:405 start_codon:yes stop_codon:yes gene_type:complete